MTGRRGLLESRSLRRGLSRPYRWTLTLFHLSGRLRPVKTGIAHALFENSPLLLIQIAQKFVAIFTRRRGVPLYRRRLIGNGKIVSAMLRVPWATTARTTNRPTLFINRFIRSFL